MLTAPRDRRARHYRRGIEDDDDHQPAQRLNGHRLDDQGSDQDGWDSSDREADDHPKVDLADLEVPDACPSAHQGRTGGHAAECVAIGLTTVPPPVQIESEGSHCV